MLMPGITVLYSIKKVSQANSNPITLFLEKLTTKFCKNVIFKSKCTILKVSDSEESKNLCSLYRNIVKYSKSLTNYFWDLVFLVEI